MGAYYNYAYIAAEYTSFKNKNNVFDILQNIIWQLKYDTYSAVKILKSWWHFTHISI